MADELNKSTPMQLDEYTRLDSVNTVKDERIRYYYTLFLYDKNELDMSSIEENIAPHIIHTIQTSPEMKKLREENITFDYIYFDKNGEVAYQLSVTPEMYKGKEE
ncbi:MAG: hypothetical protein LUH22_19550 [Bacteroides sp.]|nr:hypothetical protein [Bacteroides sp.]